MSQNITFSTGLNLSDFKEGRASIGQFTKADLKQLKSLVKSGVLESYRTNWNNLKVTKTFYRLKP